MNIVEKTKEILSNCTLMDIFNKGNHIDYTDKSLVNNYGLYTSGETLQKVSVCGEKTKVHSFTIYSVLDTFDDVDRLNNSTFLIDLGDYLESLKIEPFKNGTKWVTIQKFKTSNGMLYETLENKKSIYQFQLNITYTESEELL